MKDKEINMAIALERGWSQRGPDYWVHEYHDSREDPPDHCLDLNAMHEAENGLTSDDHAIFRLTLIGVLTKTEYERSIVSATARQRAEAFLRLLGKWVD